MGRFGASVINVGRGDVVMAYAYRAARADGAMESGVLEAESHDGAASLLSARGLFPLEIQVESAMSGVQKRLPPFDLALGLRMLATLLESGLPMSRALGALEELAPQSWSAALPSIVRQVREGRSLAAALAAAPVEIPAIVLGIVRAGEGGSGVALSVRRAAELTEQAATTRAALIAALAYPCVLAFAGTASIALLVGLVLPRFGAILIDLGQEIPTSTRIVLNAAAIVRVSALPLLLLVLILFVAFRAWVATTLGARHFHELLLSLPLVGAVRLSQCTSRVAGALAALLESGVPLSTALVHASRASGDAALTERLLSAREHIVHGHGIARSLAAEGAMTSTAIRLIGTGEESGRLASMLTHASSLERERAERALRALVRLLEPTMIVVFGGLVGLVAAALLQAIYSVRPTT
jgi:general secretion pathway protein F